MPIFETPKAISATVELSVGNVRVAASDRTDTVVEVRPTDPADNSDVEAAQRVRVDYANGVLQIVGPKGRMFDFSRKSRSVEVTIELPSGSTLSGDTQVGDLTATGRLGETRFRSAAGSIRAERTGALRASTSAGSVAVDAAGGDADVHTASGRIQLGDIDGGLVVKNSNGEIEVGDVTGNVQARSSNGSIILDRVGGNVDAKTANGSVRVGQVSRGTATLATSMGDLEIGIAKGTAAWLEVGTSFGQVSNELDDVSQPGEADERVEVRAHTSFGGITIRRA